MSKKLANKKTKRLLTEAQLKQQSLPKSDFTSNWQGRIFIRDPERSFIANQIGIKEKGEYAIKTR